MDEHTPLIQSVDRPVDDPERLPQAKGETRSGVDMVFFAIAVLGKSRCTCHTAARARPLIWALSGIFLAIGDEYFVFTTSGHIASDFHRLSLAPWLITAYNLGYSVTLPMVREI